jgi:hypothetical protein
LNIHYKKVLKQILSLYINVADPAIYILSGLLPIEAEIHIKVLTFFGNITRSEHTSIEWRLAERQLQVKKCLITEKAILLLKNHCCIVPSSHHSLS